MCRMEPLQPPDRQPYRDPVIEEYKKHLDIGMIRENLKLTPEQRLKKLEALMRGIDAMNKAGRESRQQR